MQKQTPEQPAQIRVVPFQLMQWRAWVRMEIRAGKQCKHSSGRSVRRRATLALGLPKNTSRENLVEHLTSAIDACADAGAELPTVVAMSTEVIEPETATKH